MDPEMLARLVFCFENNPERHDGIISGAGGGGYLALVVKDSLKFAENHDEAIHLQIRRA